MVLVIAGRYLWLADYAEQAEGRAHTEPVPVPDRLAEVPGTDRFLDVSRLPADGYVLHVEATYPMEKAPDAHAHVQAGHTRGKVLITVG